MSFTDAKQPAMPSPELYAQVTSIALQIEAELKRLNRWSGHQLPNEMFENMGAFGSNTMAFEQWLQFVLIPRIHSIANEKGEFPDSSQIAPYAIRVLDNEAGPLHQLLYDLDVLIGGNEFSDEAQVTEDNSVIAPTVSVGDTEIPAVLFTLIEVLPQFEGEDLEAQLQTYDTFLGILSPSVRPTIAKLLNGAASKTVNEKSKVRIFKAANSVANGGRAASP
jgi:uncharacterized protein YqcC (DUF446 family)